MLVCLYEAVYLKDSSFIISSRNYCYIFLFSPLNLEVYKHRQTSDQKRFFQNVNKCLTELIFTFLLALWAWKEFLWPSFGTVTSVVALLLRMTRNYDKFITCSGQNTKQPTRTWELKQYSDEKFCIWIILESCVTVETSTYRQHCSAICLVPATWSAEEMNYSYYRASYNGRKFVRLPRLWMDLSGSVYITEP